MSIKKTIQIVKLGEICKYQSSNIKQCDLENSNGNFPIYGASGFIKNIDFFKQKKPYVAVVKDGAGIGRVMQLPAYSSVIGTMQYIIPNNNVDVRYLAYAMEYMNLSKYFSGATIPHIYFKDYQKEKLPLPSLAEQRQIATNLNKVTHTIDLCNAILEKLDILVKSRFVEMFGDYQNEVILGQIAEITGGITKNSKRENLPLKLPYLRVANVFFAKIDITEVLEIGLTEEERDKTLLEDNDLLFVEGNGSPDQIGRVAIWKNEISPCVHQNHLIKTRIREKTVLPIFVMHYFMTQQGRNQIKAKAVSTSGLYTLSVSKISDLTIPLPPLDLQEQFAAFVEQTDKSKLKVKQVQKKAETLKNALMQEYFG